MFEFMLHQRKDYRLKTYDYSSTGSYFITVCVKNRESILWKNVRARIARPQFEDNLSHYGNIVTEAISNINKCYPMVEVDKYTIMPDHLHMILTIKAQQEQEQGRAMRAPTVATLINQMKGYVTKKSGFSFWQKLYYDHIVRDEKE
ncbi:MAG: transposase [Acutalibacteraceae bacterium]